MRPPDPVGLPFEIDPPAVVSGTRSLVPTLSLTVTWSAPRTRSATATGLHFKGRSLLLDVLERRVGVAERLPRPSTTG